MKKNIFLALATIFCSVGLISCSSDDNSQSTKITISEIYLEDASSSTTNHDRLVDFARLGQTIRIHGTGFTGLKHIYINGYDTYFNNALLTDNDVWVSLNTKTPVSDAPAELRNTIILAKDETQTTHEFIIRAAKPYINSISPSLAYPGELVYVYGGNLQETSKVDISGVNSVVDIINDPTGDGEWFAFVMPDIGTASGSLHITCANGEAESAHMFNCYEGIIIDFDEVYGNQGYWNWSETGSMCDNTDLANDPLSGSRGKCALLVPQRLLDNGGIVAGKGRATEWWTAGNDNVLDDWTHFTNNEYIKTTDPLSDLAIQFDIYCPEAWNGTGQIQVTIQNNISFLGYGTDETKSSNTQTCVVVPWIKDNEPTDFITPNWTTITIPLTSFSKYANMVADNQIPTFADIIADRAAASYCNFGIGFVNTDFTYGGVDYLSTVFNQKIYIDNIRIVHTTAPEISDFDD